MTLTWIPMGPDYWRSTCNRYTIIRSWLPEETPREAFTLRRVDPAMMRAHPTTVGYFRAEHYALWGAQQQAERDAYTVEHAAEANVPDGFPSIAQAEFYWPISDGTKRAALVLVGEEGHLVARVVGMSRDVDRYEPVTYAELDVTELAAVSAEGKERSAP